MADSNTLARIRENIEGHLGQKVILKADKGRKKVMVKEGVLENTYPSIFVVKVEEGFEAERRISYSYSDVLTSTVQLTVSKDNTRISVS